MIDFTEYIVFFDFSTFRPLGGGDKMINFTEYIDFFSTFRVLTSCWEVKMFDFMNILVFFDFSTSQTLGGRS